jgi:two-component system OmpR family sensor kinase/two-component system sensor histidine kinase QseC
VRYAGDGSRVEVRLGTEGGAAVLQVDDAGPGIPKEERERVFDRFYRRTSGTGSEQAGTGLGLAIVRSIAERHGATVALSDSPLGGLRVTLRFPSGDAAGSADNAGAVPAAMPTLAGATPIGDAPPRQTFT